MERAELDTQLFHDLERYTQLLASLDNWRAELRESGRVLKRLGAALDRDPFTCTADWALIRNLAQSAEQRIREYRSGTTELLHLQRSLLRRGCRLSEAN